MYAPELRYRETSLVFLKKVTQRVSKDFQSGTVFSGSSTFVAFFGVGRLFHNQRVIIGGIIRGKTDNQILSGCKRDDRTSNVVVKLLSNDIILNWFETIQNFVQLYGSRVLIVPLMCV